MLGLAVITGVVFPATAQQTVPFEGGAPVAPAGFEIVGAGEIRFSNGDVVAIGGGPKF
jgi:hypothetical protein